MPALVALFLAIAAGAHAQDVAIDVTRSTITIQVGKTGLLASAGHDHVISAPISSGMIREGASPYVAFAIDAARLRVMPDRNVDAKTQEQIQQDMDRLTLDTKQFPRIEFHSTHVESVGQSEWNVTGELSLHGVTKPVSITVRRNGAGYAAHTVVKQSDYGIKPISVGGGMIKVKNEVRIDFQIFTRAS